ncbi:MAG: peptide chain release factor N(5)-glutamine methyltransferase [Pirellulales bacterium]
MPDDWTIGRLLQWTADYLKQHGAETPRLDAEVLLAHARGCQRIQLYTAFDEPASEELRTKFRALVKERAEGKPVAYLVGYREFYSMNFRVTPDVLVPRPETELLVVRLLDIAKERGAGKPIAIADVGVGSGIIAVVAAKRLSNARITALDQSREALDVARGNAESHGVADRIEWIQSDLFAAVPDGRKFDIVASNPPYISEGEYQQLSKTVKDFEPRAALVAGPRGTEVIERLLPQAAERLNATGWLLIEVSPMIEPQVRAFVEADGRFSLEPTVKDLAGQPRVVQVRRM